jgi:ribosomal protein S18 acetylase RimI-like enzyme
VTAFRRAGLPDAEAVLGHMRTYYAEDGYPFDPARANAALQGLLEDERLGEVWLACDGSGRALGYVVICLGWSLEYQGRDAFIDEVFVEPAARGKGLGRALVDHAIERCRALGVQALHLEVERTKAKTQDLYRSLGFADNDRRLMSKKLTR